MSVSWRNIGSDTFDRADNGFGNIDGGEQSGAVWSALAGTWVIDTNRGGATTAAQSVIVVDLGECDGEVYVTLETASDDGGLIARAVDNNNYLVLIFNASGNTVKLWKQVATAWTALTADLAVTDGVNNGSVIKMILRGSTIVIVVDDVFIGSVTETDHQAATKHGVRENAAGAKSFYDDFGFRRREQEEPSILVAQNMGVEVLDPKDAPSLHPAQNVGLEVKTSAQPTLYLDQNTGDYDAGSISDQLGPEFAFPPRIEFLIPSYGREASSVKLEGVGFGDECTFLRFGQDDAFDASGDYDSPGTGYARGSVDQISGTWTLELWFRSQLSGKYGTAARESDGSLVELCDYNAGSPIVRYTVELLNGRVNARIGASSCALTPDYYDDGRMHHIRVVYTGGSLNLLVDGIFIGSGAGADNAVDWIRLAGTSTYLRADIREVRLCLANLGTASYDSDDEWTPTPHGSDVGLWHCDDGSGTTVTDSSGEGNDLDLQGDDWLWIDWDFALQIYLGVDLCGGPTEVRNLGCTFTIPVGADTGQIKAKHTQVHIDESNTKTFTVLPEIPLRGTGYEVRIYDRDNYGTLLAILENAYDVGGQHELNQAGAGQFNLHASDAKATATIIRHGNLCRIYWEGLERYAFIIEQIAEILIAEGDETAQVYMCSGRGVQTLLEHALVYPPNWPTREPYKTNYTAKTVGYIVKDQVDKAIARGALTNFSYDFDATTDSQGTLWPETFDLDLEPGVTLWSVIQQFVSLGYDVHLGSDLELHVYVARGLDRTVGDNPVIFRQGHNLFAKQRDSSSAEVKTHALVAGADTLSEFAKASVFPRRETFMDARSADSVGTAQKTAAMTLELLCVEDIGFAAEVVSIEGCSEVFEDFNIGDWVLVDVPGKLDLVSYRIRGITMSVGEDDKAHWVVDFNSIRHEWGVRLKRMLDAMTGGSLRGETGSGRTEGTSPTTMVDAAGGKGAFECTVRITVDDAAAFKVQDTSLNVAFLVDTVTPRVTIPVTLLLEGAVTLKKNAGEAFLVTMEDDTKVFDIDTTNKWVQLVNGTILRLFSGAYDGLTGQWRADTGLLQVGAISEVVADVGVTIESVLIKDGEVDGVDIAVHAATAAAHHAVFTLTEHSAIGDAAPHHAKYTGVEAIAAVEGEATLDLGGDVTIAAGKTLKVASVLEIVADAGVSIEGVRALDFFLELDEISKPANPAADKVRLYAKDKGGVSWLYFLSDDGTETELGGGGASADETQYLDLIAGTTIKGQWGGWSPRASSSAADGWGIYEGPTETDSASARSLYAGGIAFRQRTTAVIGGEAYISTYVYPVHNRRYDFAILIKFALEQTTNERFFIMAHTTTPPNIIDEEEPAATDGAEYVGLSYDTGRGDTNWMLRSGDGAADDVYDTTVAASTDVMFLRITVDDATPAILVELLDSSMAVVATKNFITNLPATDTDLYFTMVIKTLATEFKYQDLYYCNAVNRI